MFMGTILSCKDSVVDKILSLQQSYLKVNVKLL